MEAATQPVLARFRAGLAALPKHARLREAIIAAVQAGELPVGMKMTGERELSASLGLSLGTTQKALGRLVDDGFLVRRQGHGTFVGTTRQAVAGSWHYRFVAPNGTTELPVFTSILERRLVTDTGPWSAALGADEKGYVMLLRRLEIGGKFDCSSRMYLPASRFARLLKLAERRLADTNLKTLLEADFAAPTLHSDGVAHVVRCLPADARLLKLAPGSSGLQVQIRGYSFGRVPITFQRMFVPPTEYGLKLDFNPPQEAPGGYA
jgi:DNA-binding GntR family transcriptional regulator